MSDHLSMSGPTLIGIGAQKCASSWVHAVLGNHPDIGISNPKELNFFSYYFDHGAIWYKSFFKHCANKPVRAEVSPSYLYDPRAANRAYRFNPELCVVVILRDPVARAFSNHLHEIIKDHIPLCSFAEGLENNPSYLEQSLYARHLRPWFDYFPKERIHVILTEDIPGQAEVITTHLYRFAGLKSSTSFPVLAERRNISDQARWPLLRQGLRFGGNSLRKMRLQSQLMWLKSRPVFTRLLSKNSQSMHQLVPAIDPDTRARLDEVIADDLTDLARLLGRAVFPWPSWDRTR